MTDDEIIIMAKQVIRASAIRTARNTKNLNLLFCDYCGSGYGNSKESSLTIADLEYQNPDNHTGYCIVGKALRFLGSLWKNRQETTP